MNGCYMGKYEPALEKCFPRSCCSVKSRFLCNRQSPINRFSPSLNNCSIRGSRTFFNPYPCCTFCRPQRFCNFCIPCSLVNSCGSCCPCVPCSPYGHSPPQCGFCNPCNFPSPCNFCCPCGLRDCCPPCNPPCYPESCSPGSGDSRESPCIDNSKSFNRDCPETLIYSSNDFVVCDFDKFVPAALGSNRSRPEKRNCCSSNNSCCLPPRDLAPGEVFLNPTYTIELKNGVPYRRYPMSAGTRCCDEEFCSNTREFFYRYPIDPRFFSNRGSEDDKENRRNKSKEDDEDGQAKQQKVFKRDELDEKKDRDLEKEKKKSDKEFGEYESKPAKNQKGKKGKKK